MYRLVLKSVFPTLKEAKETILFKEFCLETERGWLFFDTKREMEAWIEIDVSDERGPF